MTTSETIRTYARVLFELATASGEVDAVDAGLRSVAETVRGNLQLRDALADSSVSGEKKRAIMADLFSADMAPEVVAIATMAVERGYVASLSQVAEEFSEIAESKRGIVVADVTTVIPLTDELRASLTDKLAASLGRPVTLRERVDASILGGIKINVAGRVLDGSLSSQLDAMRVALTKASQGGEA